MFNDDVNLTQLVLERIKNMTRRTIPQKTLDFVFNDFRHAYYEATLDWLDEKEALEQCFFAEKMKKLPYQIGDVVAIAQSYRELAEASLREGYVGDNIDWQIQYKRHAGWNNKMFVKADLMPHRIRITDIKVEQLQEISDEDCLKEGILRREIKPFNSIEIKYQVPKTTIYKDTPREAFAALIDKVSGRGTWDSNPYCFCYEFELVK